MVYKKRTIVHIVEVKLQSAKFNPCISHEDNLYMIYLRENMFTCQLETKTDDRISENYKQKCYMTYRQQENGRNHFLHVSYCLQL